MSRREHIKKVIFVAQNIMKLQKIFTKNLDQGGGYIFYNVLQVRSLWLFIKNAEHNERNILFQSRLQR